MIRRMLPAEWRPLRDAHRAAVEPLCAARVWRQQRQLTHPVHDFLFDYYAVRPAHLRRWSPGIGVEIVGADRWQLGWQQQFECTGDGWRLPPFPDSRRDYLDWLSDFLSSIDSRPPQYGCFGLHEWAMVYRADTVRHTKTPLRLSPAEINALVEASELRCTHFDAFRFFTPAAAPRNRIALTRADTAKHEQAACIHANMDLFKYALRLSPWCPSELLLASLDLAKSARDIDMRASPYDLVEYNLRPIRIETRAGRDEYVAHQQEIAGQAEPLRHQLLSLVQRLRLEVERKGPKIPVSET